MNRIDSLPEPPNATPSARWEHQAREALAGRRHGLRAFLPFCGPALVASVAYMDPGNFVVNIQAGAKYGYTLLWVVLLANLIAILFQSLSAKLGIVTGSNLAELSLAHYSRPLVWMMWVGGEIAAMATDLAEFIGAAVGLSLLFHIPLLASMSITGLVTYAALVFGHRGTRRLEIIIGALVGVVGLSYVIELIIVPLDWGAVALHTFVPQLVDGGALTLAVGIVGATVMPHAIYLHSALTQSRVRPDSDAERRRLVRFSNREVVIALAFAGLVNMAILMMASGAFHAGHAEVDQLETAYHTLTPLLGGAAAGVFLVSLIASGLASSVVGTMAGQVIMQGFVGFRIPVWIRRLVTMVPAFIVVGFGINVTTALVISQVVLSMALPIPMITLLRFTRRADLMGDFVNGRLTVVAAGVGCALVLALNLLLVLQTFGAWLPGLHAGGSG